MTVGGFVMVNTYLLQLFILNFWASFIERYVILTNGSYVQIARRRIGGTWSLWFQFSECTNGEIFSMMSGSAMTARGNSKGISFKVESGKEVAIVGASEQENLPLPVVIPFLWRYGGFCKNDKQDIQRSITDSLRKALVSFLRTLSYLTTIFIILLWQAWLARRWKCAELAQVHQFIMGLPDGYNTPVREKG